jgi:cyclopropane-fatty-acyl-phospholipid synthase
MGSRIAALEHGRRVISAIFGSADERAFDVRYWNGSIERAGRPAAGYGLAINRPGALRRMLLPPSELSIAEAFLSGDVDIDGDLEAAVTLGDEINARLRSVRTLAGIARHLLALPIDDRDDDVAAGRASGNVDREGKRHDRARDRAAIRYHYDVGNDFYALWLDDQMVYSCAYFASPDDDLERAQTAKLDLICRKLRLRPGERMLDVGCGWGALVMHAARQYGVVAHGITLSDAQASLARQRIGDAGLGDRCQIEIRDYRDLPRGVSFDKIASVGMVEHVGIDRLPDYFESLYRSLADGGLLLNHGIVNASTRPLNWRQRLERRLWRRDAFIDQYVFPDGKLVALHAVVAAAEAAGFETRDVESLREHYALTLREWLRRLARNSERAAAATSERTCRTWRLYMTAATHGFASGKLNVVQSLLGKPGAAGRVDLPLRRRV